MGLHASVFSFVCSRILRLWKSLSYGIGNIIGLRLLDPIAKRAWRDQRRYSSIGRANRDGVVTKSRKWILWRASAYACFNWVSIDILENLRISDFVSDKWSSVRPAKNMIYSSGSPVNFSCYGLLKLLHNMAKQIPLRSCYQEVIVIIHQDKRMKNTTELRRQFVEMLGEDLPYLGLREVKPLPVIWSRVHMIGELVCII